MKIYLVFSGDTEIYAFLSEKNAKAHRDKMNSNHDNIEDYHLNYWCEEIEVEDANEVLNPTAHFDTVDDARDFFTAAAERFKKSPNKRLMKAVEDMKKLEKSN